ncbi:hypothetical protein GBO34_00925 [Roseivirga pacifica]|uniref:hypothetical protein n=1 Tax=Roseivirga pacifica TaxID=1267423 RepID=UPI002095C8C4|nr:hypothetical protein [Roseivirga pacifica]MCO6367876.1 hypothetical protein [Roseivirga pacifica]MCO6377248.1 hypothetical protein [Roseivirga pacifica]
MQNDFTKEITSEVQMIISIIRQEPLQVKEFYIHLAIFWLTGVFPLVLNLTKLKKEYKEKTQQQRERMALAYLAMHLDNQLHEEGAGLNAILQERERQIEKGYTTARDLANYRHNDDLKNFAIYRLTDDRTYYPYLSPRHMNHVQKHSETERQIQGGAILLAHILMRLASGQYSKPVTHSKTA